MDNMFSGLEELGLSNSNMDLFGEEEEKHQSEIDKEKDKIEMPEFDENDYIFDKTMTCPVCNKSFKTKQVKIGKPRFAGTDTDLRPVYQGIDTVKYDTVVCLHCGYAALMRNFDSISPRQAKNIKENISKNFKGIAQGVGPYSYDIALQRSKLALYNSVVKQAKLSDRAYLCLKIAWLYRGALLNLDKNTPDYDKVAKEFAINELQFTKNAYDGFMKAIAKEMPPIAGMDEVTINYLMSDLGRRCHDYDNAEKFAFGVIGSRTAPAKVKEKARVEIEMIKKDKEGK